MRSRSASFVLDWLSACLPVSIDNDTFGSVEVRAAARRVSALSLAILAPFSLCPASVLTHKLSYRS